MDFTLKIWKYNAKRAYKKYLRGTIPTKGFIKAPREIILEYFPDNVFDVLCQNKNQTHYVLLH